MDSKGTERYLDCSWVNHVKKLKHINDEDTFADDWAFDTDNDVLMAA